MTQIKLVDHFQIDKKDVRITNDGYLVATPRVARSGIQIYGGREVGKPTMDRVRVYRSPDEVVNKDSMATFAYRPLTDDHPSESVNSSNWRDHAKGQTGGEVARDGEFLRVPAILMDQKVIDKWKDGKAELSVGYTCDLAWEPGKDPVTGEAYDAVQTTIRANHIAIVRAARGGDKLRIGDDDVDDASPPDKSGNRGERTMSDRTATFQVDGIMVEMTDKDAQIVQRQLKILGDGAADLTTKLKVANDTLVVAQTKLVADADTAKKLIETKDAELVTVKKQLEDAKLSPAKLDEMVKDRQQISGKAKVVLGDKLVTDGKTDVEIMRQVVDAKLGDAAKGWTDEQIKTSFITLTADVTASAVTDTARAFSAPSQHSNQPKEKAYDSYDKKLQDAWKTPAPAAH